MNISHDRLVVERIEEPKKEGFEIVNVQDSSTYLGRVIYLPDVPVYMSNRQIELGDTVLFAKYSPDTHEIDHENKTMRFVKIEDLLAVI